MATNLLQDKRSPHIVHAFSTAWGYIRHELTYLTWALMEIALLAPTLLAIFNWTRYWSTGQTTLWLLLLVLLPFNLIRLMSLIGLLPERQRLVMVAALFLTAFFGIRTILHDATSLFDFSWLGDFYRSLAEPGNQLWTRDVAIFLVTCFAWWRGIRLTDHTPNIDRAGLRLRVGGLLLAPLVIWMASDLLLQNVMPFILLFFTAGLSAIALIRAEQTEQERSGQAAPLTPQWVASIFLAALAVVFTGSLLAAIVSGQPPDVIAAWVAPIWLAIRMAATAVFTTAIYMASPIITLFIWLIQLIFLFLSTTFSGALGALQNAIPQLAPAATPEFLPQATDVPEVIGATDGTKLIVILAMLAVTLLVTLALSRLYRRAVVAARDSEQLGRQSLEMPESPNLARRMLEKLGLLKGMRAAISIRRIYWQMCRAAAGAGYPRLDVETPYEYLNSLTQVWPSHTADSRLITRAYVKIRYGEFPESTDELNQIRTAWQRLEATKPTPRSEDMPL